MWNVLHEQSIWKRGKQQLGSASQVAHLHAGAYPIGAYPIGFCSMKRLGLFLLPPE